MKSWDGRRTFCCILQKTIRAYWLKCRVKTNGSIHNHNSFRDYHYMMLPQTLLYRISTMQSFKFSVHSWFLILFCRYQLGQGEVCQGSFSLVVQATYLQRWRYSLFFIKRKSFQNETLFHLSSLLSTAHFIICLF